MESTDARIRELVRDLRPVRPIPRLSATLVVVATVWLANVIAWRSIGGPGLLPASNPGWSELPFLAILAGLVLLAIGATVGALAGSVPGRENAARAGLVVGAIGIAIALVSGIVSTPLSELQWDLQAFRACLTCIRHSVVLGLLSIVVSSAFIGYAVIRHPNSTASLAVVGGVALGAIVVHATCDASDGAHQLVSHVLAPIFAAAVLTLPVSFAMRAFAKVSESQRSGKRTPTSPSKPRG